MEVRRGLNGGDGVRLCIRTWVLIYTRTYKNISSFLRFPSTGYWGNTKGEHQRRIWMNLCPQRNQYCKSLQDLKCREWRSLPILDRVPNWNSFFHLMSTSLPSVLEWRRRKYEFGPKTRMQTIQHTFLRCIDYRRKLFRFSSLTVWHLSKLSNGNGQVGV